MLNESAKTFTRVVKLMGNRFEISVVHDSPVFAEAQIDIAIAEIARIEALLTTYNPDSQCNSINHYAGIQPVVVDAEVFDLVQRAIKISVLTQGAFDISYGGVDKSLWNFDQKMTALPSADIAKKMVELIDYRNIELEQKNHRVFLKKIGMRIGFGGIGKGYAADRAKEILKKNGVKAGVINASGDMCTWGTQANGKPWTIAIADPNAKNTALSYMNISDKAVATSGNYEKYVTIAGKRYSHTIDPKTGLPVTGIKSVTVIAPVAELADALATPITVMGVKVGLDMINQMKGIACLIIDDNDRIFTSDNIKLS